MEVDLGVPLAPGVPAAPHDASGERVVTHDLAGLAPPPRPARRWVPRRVVATPAAYDHEHGLRVMARVEELGLEVERLRSNRLTGLRGGTERETYAAAKSTMAIVVSPPSRRRLQPIAPSADWRFDLAEGCPAHCQYCYLAGSLSGPPVTRVYADLDDILGGLAEYAGRGTVTSRRADRAGEGTTFEASCYTDPLALEHLTGSWRRAVEHFGAWDADVQLRWTTKYADVDGFLDVAHHGRTRVRFSVNCAPVAERFEGGTARVADRLAALRRLALAGYPVGLTIAPIMPLPDWREHYGALLAEVAAAVEGLPGLDLTAELITHRFTPGSKEVLLGWYPRTKLEMDEAARTRKHGKFGAVKWVYPRDTMAELRDWFTGNLPPSCRVLYWT
ncbi:SPL family radical SAM protein [Spirilliplanes yamanashiensis]|uniref:Spore photoproduct lyase n=1 Tax=Spirilliplanes yamanashiensis TaxID=42233 RepID=A0A8J3Y9N5_9ACTN|nr:radical SAM protein [Spirilliplanes yamanashiensis]MDP9815670.1 spore photoproduct lyase [Spirilliplanes yamanashiensis]GIJ03924.1 spore photoproduct lyase [Spirilliplanes yamanashiensis]